MEVSRKEFKIFYEIDVKMVVDTDSLADPGGGSSAASAAAAASVSAGVADPSASEQRATGTSVHCLWVLRKRYRQFRALALGLERIGLLNDPRHHNVEFPQKLSGRRQKTLDREAEGKVSLA